MLYSYHISIYLYSLYYLPENVTFGLQKASIVVGPRQTETIPVQVDQSQHVIFILEGSSEQVETDGKVYTLNYV